MICNYQDEATFYKVIPGSYGNKKIVTEAESVALMFLQNTGFLHSQSQDVINANAAAFIDPENDFVKNNYIRLEGMYVAISLFGAPHEISWFKVTSVTINRDILLTNQIDNVQIELKKTTALPGVS